MSHRHNRKRVRSRSRGRVGNSGAPNAWVGAACLRYSYEGLAGFVDPGGMAKDRPVKPVTTDTQTTARSTGRKTIKADNKANSLNPRWHHFDRHASFSTEDALADFHATCTSNHCQRGVGPQDIIRFLFDGKMDFVDAPY